MSKAMRVMVLAGAAAGMCTGAFAQEQETVDTDQVRAVVREMLADAESRSSLLEGESVAGYNGKNFYLASSDGKFTMNFAGYTQFRYVASFAQNNPNGTPSRAANDSFDSGFTNRLTKLQMFGTWLSKDWGYMIEVRLLDSSGNGAAQADDLYITYKIDQQLRLMFGQYKLRFMREENLSDTTTMAAERGPIALAFGQSRSQGMQLQWVQDEMSAWVDVSDGFRTRNSNWNANGVNAINGPSESDFCVSGRFQYRFAGTEDALRQYTSKPGDPLSCQAGIAAAYEQGLDDPAYVNGAPPLPPGTNAKYQYLTYTIDTQVQGDGFGLYAAFVGANTDFRNPNPTTQRSGSNLVDLGAAVQGSWRFTENLEFFGRGDWIGLSDKRNLPAGSRENNFFVTTGFNYYIAGQAAKVTLDAIISLNPTNAMSSNTSSIVPNGNPNNNGAGRIFTTSGAIGLLGSSQGGETAIRLQFQGMF
ncbi:MAG: porin [Phycisphaerales bacterium]